MNNLRSSITVALIWCIRKLNSNKDNNLSFKLHQVADHYSTRPTNRWDHLMGFEE